MHKVWQGWASLPRASWREECHNQGMPSKELVSLRIETSTCRGKGGFVCAPCRLVRELDTKQHLAITIYQSYQMPTSLLKLFGWILVQFPWWQWLSTLTLLLELEIGTGDARGLRWSRECNQLWRETSEEGHCLSRRVKTAADTVMPNGQCVKFSWIFRIRVGLRRRKDRQTRAEPYTHSGRRIVIARDRRRKHPGLC